MSGHARKVQYDRREERPQVHRRSYRDSGIGSSSASDRAPLGNEYSTPFTTQQRDEQRLILGAVQEALDAANEKIRHLEEVTANLNSALRESNQQNRLLKRERSELYDKLDDANDDLESERRMSSQAGDESPNSNRGRSPSVSSRRTVRARQDKRSGILPESRDEKGPPAKSMGLAVISQPTRFFQVGRVFKTLWTEPAGETATDTDKEYYHPVGYGQLSFTKMRRFVVVRKRLHSCLCLAISTYGGQGSAKKDSRLEDHAIVYASTDPLPANDDFVKEPIPVIIEETNENIDPKSVIDFGRVYTVEHNVRVQNVGRVANSDKKRLGLYFIDTIGIVPDVEDEGYGGDTPIAKPDSLSDRLKASAEYQASSAEISPTPRAFTTPNPMANPFTPSIHSQMRPISSIPTQPSRGDYYSPPPGYGRDFRPISSVPTQPTREDYYPPHPNYGRDFRPMSYTTDMRRPHTISQPSPPPRTRWDPPGW